MSISQDELELCYATWTNLKNEVSKVIVGLEATLEEIFICLVASGHALLEGPPGIAKTTLAKTIANALDLKFSRIQFTPDLLPADIVGTKVYNQVKADFDVKLGPIFANFILADEINRASPKTQSALLEAMQEVQVTIEGETFRLPEPFIVVATQNPIEVEGTYPLPSAQLDRFLVKSTMNYPSRSDYFKIIRRYSEPYNPEVNRVVKKADLLKIRKIVEKVTLTSELLNYILDVVEAINRDKRVRWGISPRGALFVARASKAYALMNNRDFVTPEDIKRVLYPVLNHRIILSPEAIFRGASVSDVISDAIKSVKVPI